jgi:predicted transcriptional regulator
MSDSVPLLKVHELLAAPKPGTQLFHQVNRLLPTTQHVVTVSPRTPAGEAIALMRKHGYSQLPVVEGRSVLGLFSYRAFAVEVANMAGTKSDPSALPVEEFLEHDQPVYARLTDEFRTLIEHLDTQDAVVVGDPDQLLGLLTAMDVLRYLYGVANAFVLIEEIELSLRSLIQIAVPAAADLKMCAERALAEKYKGKEITARLENMSFDDYVGLVRDGRNWAMFEPVLGGTRPRSSTKLEGVRDLRNDVFHFKRELSAEDHQTLANCRDWLLRCTRKVKAAGEVPR